MREWIQYGAEAVGVAAAFLVLRVFWHRHHAHKAEAREADARGWDEARQKIEKVNARRLRSWKHQRQARRR